MLIYKIICNLRGVLRWPNRWIIKRTVAKIPVVQTDVVAMVAKLGIVAIVVVAMGVAVKKSTAADIKKVTEN